MEKSARSEHFRDEAIAKMLSTFEPKIAAYLANRFDRRPEEKDDLIKLDHVEFLLRKYNEDEVIGAIVHDMLVNSFNVSSETGATKMVLSEDGEIMHQVTDLGIEKVRKLGLLEGDTPDP